MPREIVRALQPAIPGWGRKSQALQNGRGVLDGSAAKGRLQRIIASFESGEAEDCLATYADGSTESFVGILSEFAVQPFSPQTAAIRASATIAVTFADDGEEADVYVFNPAGGS